MQQQVLAVSQGIRQGVKSRKLLVHPGLLHPAGGVPGPAGRFTLSGVPVTTVP
jgi:hypothetical protein